MCTSASGFYFSIVAIAQRRSIIFVYFLLLSTFLLQAKCEINTFDREIVFLSYGDNTYNRTKARVREQAENMKIFSVIKVLGPENIGEDFKSKFSKILRKSRGGGYWIWKPYFIKKTLDEMKEGDIRQTQHYDTYIYVYIWYHSVGTVAGRCYSQYWLA